MLEIFFLMRFGRSLSAIARAKGRSGGWAGLGVAFWILGEVMGFFVGAMLGLGAGAYLLALVIAAAGAGVSYAVVKGLAPAASIEASLT